MIASGAEARAESTRRDVLEASPPIFRSPALDRMTRTHPAVPAVVFLPVVIASGVLAVLDLGAARALAWTAGGYLFWTLCEYWAHRTVFHFEPDHGLGERFHWMIHGVHHDHPNDRRRLVLPPVLSLPLGLLFFGLFLLVLGRPTVW